MFSCRNKDIIIIKKVFFCYKNGSNGKFLKDYEPSENNKQTGNNIVFTNLSNPNKSKWYKVSVLGIQKY